MEDQLNKLRKLRDRALLGGGPEQIQKQREQGKYTAAKGMEGPSSPWAGIKFTRLI